MSYQLMQHRQVTMREKNHKEIIQAKYKFIFHFSLLANTNYLSEASFLACIAISIFDCGICFKFFERIAFLSFPLLPSMLYSTIKGPL